MTISLLTRPDACGLQKVSCLWFALLCIGLLGWCSTASYAQESMQVEWGQIPLADMQMTHYAADTSAGAVVLSDVGSLRFSILKNHPDIQFERHRRVKVLKPTGLGQANISIQLLPGETLTSFQAQVTLPGGAQIELAEPDLLEQTSRDSLIRTKKLSFPNISPGAIIEYKYSLTSPNLITLKEWYFQDTIPVRWSEYTVAIPEMLEYAVIKHGPSMYINETKISRPTEILVGEDNVRTGTIRKEDVQIGVVEAHYVMKDLPALKAQAYLTTLEDHLARVRFEFKVGRYPGVKSFFAFSSWEAVAEELADSRYFGKQYQKPSRSRQLRAKVEPLLAGATTTAEKASRLYHYLNDNMVWNGVYSPTACADLYRSFACKTASTGDLNLMLLALFDEAGIEAYPVLSSTREHGKTIDTYPIVSQFNHVLVMAQIDDEWVFYDVGSSFRPGGLPSISALNGRGFALFEDGPKWIDLPAPSSFEMQVFKGRIDEHGNASGTWHSKYDGYSAVSKRERLHNRPTEQVLGGLMNSFFAGASIQNIALEHTDDLNQPLQTSATCTLPSLAHTQGDYLYFNAVFMPPFNKNPFEEEYRSYPVDFPYPFAEHRVYQLEMPSGYQIETLPSPLSLSMPNKGVDLQFSINAGPNNTISVVYKLQLSQLIFSVDEYSALREFFNQLIQKQSEQIVLKRM